MKSLYIIRKKIWSLSGRHLKSDDADSSCMTFTNDNGQNGDVKANDGIYSIQITLNNNTECQEEFQASWKTKRSNLVKITFFGEMKEQDLKNQFLAIDAIKEMEVSG